MVAKAMNSFLVGIFTSGNFNTGWGPEIVSFVWDIWQIDRPRNVKPKPTHTTLFDRLGGFYVYKYFNGKEREREREKERERDLNTAKCA